MKIIRTVGPNETQRRTVSRYDGITTSTGHAFMVAEANREAIGRTDCVRVDVLGGELSGHSIAVLIGAAGILATYGQVW